MANDERARLKSVVDTAVDGIVAIDERGIVETFNPAAERMFGYAADEVVGRNVRLLMPAPYGDEHDGYLKRYLETGVAHVIGIGREVTGRRKDGSTFPMRLSVGEFRLGERRCFTGIVHDLTDQKRAEERVLQLERLAAMGQMMTVLTHESRNLLQLCQANLEMLEAEIADRPEAVAFALRIQNAQHKLRLLYAELREFAAPIRLDREDYHVGNLVDQVVSELSTTHSERQIQYRENGRNVALRCLIDPFRMHQVFRNIIENSIDACADPVQISVGWSQPQFDGGPALEVALRDNGPGISAEQRKRIFEPFFTTKRGGTGLGLAISRRIVEAHGGCLTIAEKTRRGAEFVITLPRSDPGE